MLDEWSRRILNYGHPNEIVIFTTSANGGWRTPPIPPNFPNVPLFLHHQHSEAEKALCVPRPPKKWWSWLWLSPAIMASETIATLWLAWKYPSMMVEQRCR